MSLYPRYSHMVPATESVHMLMSSRRLSVSLSDLSFSLQVDPVRELGDLCVDSRAVLPSAPLPPAHDPRQEPPPTPL